MALFLRLLALVLALANTNRAQEQLPSIVKQPRDWIVDEAFNRIKYFTYVGRRSAFFSCKATGSPPPTIEWFVLKARAKSYEGPVQQNSTQFELIDNGTSLIVKDAKLHLPKVYCEAYNSLGRVRSRRAVYERRGRWNRDLRDFVSPIWITQTHALVACPNRDDLVTKKTTVGGGILRSQRNWGIPYEYRAFYDFHNESKLNKSMYSLSERPDIYWNGPFIVISNKTLKLDSLYVCFQFWKSWFITGTKQKPVHLLHEGLFPPSNGTYVPLPFLFKTLYIMQAPRPKKEVSVNLFTNSTDFVMGEPIEIDCLTFSSKMDLKVAWLKDGIVINSSSSRVFTQAIAGFGLRLVIKSLKSRDAANYTCRVVDGSSVHSASLPVRPRSPLVFLPSNGSAMIPAHPESTRHFIEGGFAILRCLYPVQPWERREVVWLINARPLPPARGRQDDHPGISTLLLENLNAATDSGAYQCLLRDPSTGRDALQTVAFVKLKPPPSQRPPRISLPQARQGLLKIPVLPNGTLTISVSMLVSDADAGRGGRVAACKVEGCPRGTACPRLTSSGRSPSGNLAMYRLEGEGPQVTRRVEIVCEDSSDPPLRSSVSVLLEPCANTSCPAAPRESLGMTEKLRKLLEQGLTAANSAWWLSSVQSLSEEVERNGMVADDFNIFLSVLDRGLQADVAAGHLQKFVDSLGRLLGAITPDIDADSGRKRQLSSGVLRLADTIARRLVVADGDRRTLRSPRLTVGAMRFSGSAKERRAGHVVQFMAGPGLTTGEQSLNETGIAVTQTAVAGRRVDFSIVNTVDLFNTPGDEKQLVLTPVVAATAILVANTSADAFPVLVGFRRPSPGAGYPRCAYWNVSEQRWAFDGCRTHISSSNLVRCRCSHLTNFALLLDVDRGTPISPIHQMVLSLLSYMLLTISVVFLVLTILVYGAFLRRETQRHGNSTSGGSARGSRIIASKVLISLCSALLLATIMFLGGSHYTGRGPACTVIGVLLHYFYLTVFCWAVVEAFHIFVTVIYISLKSNQISIHISHFFLKASIFAWGVPLVIVAVTLGVNSTRNYGSDPLSASHFCFLKTIPFFVAFLTPMSVCLVANIIILLLLVVVLHRFSYASVARGPQDQKSYWRQHVVGFIGICFILNITWIIGVVQVKGGKLVFQYLFVLVNGLQGLFIFLFYCLLRDDLRKFMRKRMRRMLGSEEKSQTTGRSVTSSEMPTYSGATNKSKPRSSVCNETAETKVELLTNSCNALNTSQNQLETVEEAAAGENNLLGKEEVA